MKEKENGYDKMLNELKDLTDKIGEDVSSLSSDIEISNDEIISDERLNNSIGDLSKKIDFELDRLGELTKINIFKRNENNN